MQVGIPVIICYNDMENQMLDFYCISGGKK